MRGALRPHPDSPGAAVTSIEVTAARPGPGRLALTYMVTGKIGSLCLPPVTAGTRADELWRHTCFEAFLRGSADDGYFEFNLSPSTQWAAYAFSGYREGMRIVETAAAPRIETRLGGGRYRLEALLDLTPLPGLADDAAWRLGLSAVIEEKGGRKSFWALAHPPGRPDFHHSDCFAHELPATWRP